MAKYIEKGTNYVYTIERIKNIDFRSIRSVSIEFTKRLPSDLNKEVYDSIQHGVCKLQSEPELNMYLHALGLMHEAKLQHAFKHLPKDFAENPIIDIIDYGCGQAIGIMCYADYLRKTGKNQNVRRITLIEPSEITLKRAALHVSCFFPKAEIITVLKGFDDLTTDDLNIDKSIPTLNIFSNVIDLADNYFNLETFCNLIQSVSYIGQNFYICIEPYFYNEEVDEKAQRFIKKLNIDITYSKIFLKGEFIKGREWTCQVIIGKDRCKCLDCRNTDISINNDPFDIKVEKLINYGYKKLSHLKIKNVAVNKKNKFIRLDFTLSTNIRGLVTEDNGKTWKKGFVNTIYTSLYAVCDTLYKGDEIPLDWSFLNRIVKNNNNTNLLNKLFIDADIDLLQLEVPVGKEYVIPLSDTKLLQINTYNHDIIISHIIKFRLSKKGLATVNNICNLIFYDSVDDVLLIMDFANSAYIDKQYNEAFRYYKLAAELDCAEAQHKLGRCFEYGDGVEQSYDEAIKWYRRAAEQGHKEAMFRLATCYRYGQGVKRSYGEAVKWYKESKTEEAQSALGEIYDREKPISNFVNKLLLILGK